MITPLYCSDCKVELYCEKTKESCKYPEGRIHGVESERPSERTVIDSLTRQLRDAEKVIDSISKKIHGDSFTGQVFIYESDVPKIIKSIKAYRAEGN